MELLLKYEEKVRVLGLEIVKEGIQPVSFIKHMLARIKQRIRVLWPQRTEARCRFDVVIFLYRTYVAGILAHSLPFMNSEGWVQRGLQTAQDEFLRSILGVGENDAALHMGAELG